MGESRGLDLYTAALPEKPLPKELEDLMRDAYERAEKHGRIVGRVTRFFPVTVGGSSRVIVEVDPETYYGYRDSPIHRVGDYLVIVDLKGKLVLGRVSSIKRSDILSLVGGGMPPIDVTSDARDPSSLATATLVELEPVMESDADLKATPTPASSSIEPQSPVIDARPGEIAKLLNLPGEGALVGALATPSGLVKNGEIPVKLPFKVFLQHVLVIGTTGSGKTTLLKNMAAEIYSSRSKESPILVFIDMNQDFVQIAFDPAHEKDTDEKASMIREKLYAGVKPAPGLIVLLPVTDSIIADARVRMRGDWCSYTRYAVKRHLEDVVKPVASATRLGEMVEYEPVKRRGDICSFEVNVNGKRLVYIPYAVNTLQTPTSSILRLVPDMTMLSMDLFRRTRERFKKQYGVYPPLLSIAAGLYLARRIMDGKRQQAGWRSEPREASNRDLEDEIEGYIAEKLRGIVEENQTKSFVKRKVDQLGMSLIAAAANYAELVANSKPDTRTVEAVYRRVSSLADSGILDLIYPEAEDSSLEPMIAVEPGWEQVMGLASEYDYPIVLDLGVLDAWGAGGAEAARILAYRVLERLKEWKHALWVSRRSDEMAKRKVVVVIDEAHQFFPQQRGSAEEQEMARQIAAMISQVARLGRARGVGLVFATHSPKDLHEIILQLSNTKIILRTERNQLEYINLPSDVKSFIPMLPDRFMVVSSYIYRDYIVAATTTPVTMHYDLSA